MFAISLALLLLIVAPQESVPRQSDSVLPQTLDEAREKYEPTRQAAIRLNDLAGNIHSEADARAFVDAVAERFLGQEHLSWITASIRHRVAHAEYEAVSNPARMIPEQRVVNVWNEYVRELDAPEETLITVAELHNLRDGMYIGTKSMWKREGITQQFWTIPNIYAVDADGRVASGCRAVEALKILHDMFRTFQLVQGARARVQKGILVSDTVRQQEQSGTPKQPTMRSGILATRNENPVLPAEIRYVEAHGEGDYTRLMERLFVELFPTD
jgi:hypothetical protein